MFFNFSCALHQYIFSQFKFEIPSFIAYFVQNFFNVLMVSHVFKLVTRQINGDRERQASRFFAMLNFVHKLLLGGPILQ